MKTMACFIPSSTIPSPATSTFAITTMQSQQSYLSSSSSSSSSCTTLSLSFSPYDNILHQIPTTATAIKSSSTLLTSSIESTTFLPENPLTILPILFFALLLGYASQSFINSMLRGDQGLGAFLKDGSGYSGSAFKPRSSSSSSLSSSDGGSQPLSGNDPLPWLKLPQLDFVEVAGQEQERIMKQQEQKQEEEAMMRIQLRLEQIRQDMNEELKNGNLEKATKLREELEKLVKEYGFEYREGFE